MFSPRPHVILVPTVGCGRRGDAATAFNLLSSQGMITTLEMGLGYHVCTVPASWLVNDGKQKAEAGEEIEGAYRRIRDTQLFADLL